MYRWLSFRRARSIAIVLSLVVARAAHAGNGGCEIDGRIGDRADVAFRLVDTDESLEASRCSLDDGTVSVFVAQRTFYGTGRLLPDAPATSFVDAQAHDGSTITVTEGLGELTLADGDGPVGGQP